MKKALLRYGAVLLVGGVVGSGAAAASIEPEIRTKTVTETVEVTPAACVDVIDEARELGRIFYRDRSVQKLAHLVGEAYEAGELGLSVDSIAAKMRAVADQQNAVADKINLLNLRTAAAACESPGVGA